LVPAFVGLGAPYWDAEAKGAIIGITRGTTRADIVRAALDSIAYQVRDVIVAMESDTGHRIGELRADGGAVANPYLMQFQADLLDRPVVLPKIAETTAMGAAYLAGLAEGFWESPDAIRSLRPPDTRFEPKAQGNKMKAARERWHDAVERSKGWFREHELKDGE